MKLLMTSLLALMTSFSAHADQIGNDHAARALQNKLEPIVFGIEGVNGIGITGCDPVTGAQSNFKSDFVLCVSVMTVTEEAAQTVLNLYPAGQKVDGVFVTVQAIGEIVAQPRMSAGN
jgi:hypothetical protein